LAAYCRRPLKEDSGREDSLQREHDLRAVFNAVRYVARTGGQWRYLPNDLPPWFVVYQQMQRWLLGDAGRGCTLAAARVARAQGPADGGGHRQPHLTVHTESSARAGYEFWIFPRVDLMLMAFLPIWVAMEGRPI
jgi:transposase